jgi:hypothetical protein
LLCPWRWHIAYHFVSRLCVSAPVHPHSLNLFSRAVCKTNSTTLSQDRFRTVNPAFYRGANGIVVVYDVTNKESYDRIDGWMKEALQYAQEPRTLLIGNKADLEPRQVCLGLCGGGVLFLLRYFLIRLSCLPNPDLAMRPVSIGPGD